MFLFISTFSQKQMKSEQYPYEVYVLRKKATNPGKLSTIPRLGSQLNPYE